MELCLKKKKQELIEELKEKIPTIKNSNNYKKSEICKILQKDCDHLNGMVNHANSCYFDSFLVSLFHFDNNLIKTIKYKSSNKELQDIAKKIIINIKDIKNTKSCNDLRKLFQDYDHLYTQENKKFKAINWTTSQQEPFDLIYFLHRLIKIPNNIKVSRELYGTNKNKKILLKKDVDFVSSKKSLLVDFASIYIDGSELYDKSILNLKKYIPKQKIVTEFDEENLWKPSSEQIYKKKIEKIQYLSGDLFFIHIGRLFAGEKLDTDITIPYTIKLKENKYDLYLQSIIVHHGGSKGGHYTSFINCSGNWYHYDDINFKKMKLIGSYEVLKKYKSEYIFKNCTDLIYSFITF
jgi:ubiquitin C-terminal hydrolase